VTPEALSRVMEATWPARHSWRLGPFRLREGAGGGKRVSAASVEAAWSEVDLARAEAAMAQPLFLLRPEEDALDQALATRGYRIVDPVLAYACDADNLPPPLWFTTFPHWPPLQMACDLWAEGGIGPARLAVMARVAGPKAVILGRVRDRPSGVAFVAGHQGQAMVHAVEVAEASRRQGVAEGILRAAAQWARGQGLDRLSLVVTTANAPARALYEKLGMQVVGGYHYRQR
jgi:ribosomal protein S18 acetylase RimI-like enzyme